MDGGGAGRPRPRAEGEGEQGERGGGRGEPPGCPGARRLSAGRRLAVVSYPALFLSLSSPPLSLGQNQASVLVLRGATVMPAQQQRAARRRKQQRRKARTRKAADRHAQQEPGNETYSLGRIGERMQDEESQRASGVDDGKELMRARSLLQGATVHPHIVSHARFDDIYNEPALLMRAHFFYPEDLLCLGLQASVIATALVRVVMYMLCQQDLNPMPPLWSPDSRQSQRMLWRDEVTLYTLPRVLAEPCLLRITHQPPPVGAARLRVSLRALIRYGEKMAAAMQRMPEDDVWDAARQGWQAVLRGAAAVCKELELPPLAQLLMITTAAAGSPASHPTPPRPKIVLLAARLLHLPQSAEAEALARVVLTIEATAAGEPDPPPALEAPIEIERKCVVCDNKGLLRVQIQTCCLDYGLCMRPSCRAMFKHHFCPRNPDFCNLCRAQTEQALALGDIQLQPGPAWGTTRCMLRAFSDRPARPLAVPS